MWWEGKGKLGNVPFFFQIYLQEYHVRNEASPKYREEQERKKQLELFSMICIVGTLT